MIEFTDVISTTNVTTQSNNDTTTQGSVVCQSGVGFTGESTGDEIQILGPLGYWSPPLPSLQGQNGTKFMVESRSDVLWGFAGRDYKNQERFKYTAPGAVQVGALGSTSAANIQIALDDTISLNTSSDSTAQKIVITTNNVTLGNGTSPLKLAYIDPLCTALTAVNEFSIGLLAASQAASNAPDPTGTSFQVFAKAVGAIIPALQTALQLYSSATPQNGTVITVGT